MKKMTIVLLCVILALSMVACGSSSKNESVDSVQNYPGQEPSRDTGVSTPEEAGDFFPPEERKIIQNGELNVEVSDLAASVREIEEQVSLYGGYLGESNVGQNHGGGAWANMEIRIPAAEFDAMIAFVEDKGKVNLRRVYRDDVTTFFVDTEARLKVLKAEEESILSILAEAKEIEDVLNIRRELRMVRSEIEALEGELKYYASRVDFSSIRVYLEQPRISETSIETPGFAGVLEKAISQFTRNINAMIRLAGDFFVFFIGGLPVLVPLIVLFYGLWKWTRRKGGNSDRVKK